MRHTASERRTLPLPLTPADWGRAGRGLTAPLRAPRGGFAAVLVSIPLFLASVLVWYLVARIATYGLFWVIEGGDHADAWGGPSLLGAWTVHTLIALALAMPALGLIRPLTARLDRLTARGDR